MSSGDIVVGVDQSPEARWAVLWAAREARLRRCHFVACARQVLSRRRSS